MVETNDTARIYKVHNVVPKLDKKKKERLEQEALITMHEIFSRENQTKKA